LRIRGRKRRDKRGGGGVLGTSVLDVSMPFEVIVCSSVVGPVDTIDGVRRATQLREVAELNLLGSWKAQKIYI